MDGGIGLPHLISIGAVFSVIGVAAGIIINNYIQKLQKDAASRNAEKIRSDAEREAEHLLRDARVSAKSETIKMREECEAELKERRREQSNVEKRLAQREELLDRRADSMDAKLKNIEKQEAEIAQMRERVANREQELNKSISRQIDELERISGYSREEAREVLLEKLKNEVRNESGLVVRNVLEEVKERIVEYIAAKHIPSTVCAPFTNSSAIQPEPITPYFIINFISFLYLNNQINSGL